MSNKDTIEINKKYLEELVEFQGRQMVGQVCRRLELGGDSTIIKKSVKDLVYEGFRQFGYLLKAYEHGIRFMEFKFVVPKKSKEEQNG